MSIQKQLTPDEIVADLRKMDKQVIHGSRIFKQAADLIEELQKPKPWREVSKFITNPEPDGE
jgi:hypothetical protein